MNMNSKKTILLMLEKGRRSAKSAVQHLKHKDFDFASSRAYYAVFHYMQAALYLRGLTFSKHSAVIAEFNRHFIKTGIFPRLFSKYIELLFKDRQIGDYDYFGEIDLFQARGDIAKAASICEEIEKFILRELK
jgi:uncharacterized protein (UPF0332 family)